MSLDHDDSLTKNVLKRKYSQLQEEATKNGESFEWPQYDSGGKRPDNGLLPLDHVEPKFLADINHLMEKCKVIEQSDAARMDDHDDEQEEDAIDLPESADELLASIQGLVAKCESIQQAAQDMENDCFWKEKITEKQNLELSGEGTADSVN